MEFPLSTNPRLDSSQTIKSIVEFGWGRKCCVSSTSLNTRGGGTQQEWDVTFMVVFGGLAILAVLGTAVDPLALRPRLSPGLPLSNEQLDKFWKNKRA